MNLTVTDLFCGAGGSSIGLTAAGAQLVIAANHSGCPHRGPGRRCPDCFQAAHDRAVHLCHMYWRRRHIRRRR